MFAAALCCAVCAVEINAFAPPSWWNAIGKPRVDTNRAFSTKMSSVSVEKKGTGENRMTPGGFSVPLVEKVSVGTSQGYEWKVKADVLDQKKLNMQEKIKLAKPGLSIIDELEKLAAEAKEKGGAQVIIVHREKDSLISFRSLFCVLCEDTEV
jgi:hypothetical protein